MNAMQETVVLVHGVLMTGKVMAVLARRLKGCGYRTVLFDYPSRRRNLRFARSSNFRAQSRVDPRSSAR